MQEARELLAYLDRIPPPWDSNSLQCGHSIRYSASHRIFGSRDRDKGRDRCSGRQASSRALELELGLGPVPGPGQQAETRLKSLQRP